MFCNFFGFYIQNCCEKNPKNTRGRCRCSKLTSPTVSVDHVEFQFILIHFCYLSPLSQFSLILSIFDAFAWPSLVSYPQVNHDYKFCLIFSILLDENEDF